MATFEVKNTIDPVQLRADLAYSANNISDAMMTQASMMAHYGVLAAEASRQVDTIKMIIETAEAMLYRKERERLIAAGEKPTEGQINSYVASHEKVIALKKNFNEAKQIEAVSKVAVQAFRHRKDMIVQQGASNREEMKGELSMSAKRARDEEFEATRKSIAERRRQQSEAVE